MDVPTMKSELPAGTFAGRLILVVGPSGAGKDTLINRVRADCALDGRVAFPRRVVTREASSFEDNEQVSAETFRQLLRHGEALPPSGKRRDATVRMSGCS